MKQLRLLAIILLLALINSKAIAQTTQASISGVVLDEKSKTIKDAIIVIKNESTGFTTNSLSNFKGVFTFKELPLGGPYTITTNYANYGEQQRTGYMLNQGDNINVEVVMQDNVQNLEVVEVISRGLKNKTRNLGASTAITSKLINALPVNGRNFTSLMDLSPLSKGGISQAN